MPLWRKPPGLPRTDESVLRSATRARYWLTAILCREESHSYTSQGDHTEDAEHIPADPMPFINEGLLAALVVGGPLGKGP